MAYKSRFRPLEKLGPGGWRRFDPEQRELPLAQRKRFAAKARPEPVLR